MRFFECIYGTFSIDSTCRYVVFKSIPIAFQPLVFKTKFCLINMSMPQKNCAHSFEVEKRTKKSICVLNEKKIESKQKSLFHLIGLSSMIYWMRKSEIMWAFSQLNKKNLGDNKLTWNVKMVMKKVGDFRVLFFWFLMSGIESRYIMYRRSDCSDRFWITFRDNKFISAETFSCIVPVNLCCWQSVSMFAKYVRQKSAQVTNIQYQRV